MAVVTYVEWRVSGQPAGGYDSYVYTWSTRNSDLPEEDARRFRDQMTGDWTNVKLETRTVTYTDWELA